MNKKLLGILEGTATIALGVLVAIFGGQTVLDIYFGVLFIVAGATFLTFAIVGLTRTGILRFLLVFLAFAFLTVGIVLVIRHYSLGELVRLLVYLLIAAGGALIAYGAYTIVKFNVFYGVGQIVIGAAAITVAVLYLTIPEFYTWFWIIVGVLVAIYGVVLLVMAILSKDEK